MPRLLAISCHAPAESFDIIRRGGTKALPRHIFKCNTTGNLDARASPAPRDAAPLLLSPVQARLSFGSGPAHPAHPADRPVAEPRPILLQIVNF
jgi:hypothetical protein